MKPALKASAKRGSDPFEFRGSDPVFAQALKPWTCPGLALALAVVLAVAGQAHAQAQPSQFGKTTVLRFLMGQHVLKLNAQEQLADLEAKPSESILVVLGDTRPLEEQWDAAQLKNFLNGGGALLVATDHRTGACLEQVFGVRVSGNHLRAVDEAGKYLGKLEDCPVMQQAPDHPELFNDVGQVVTNVPSSFRLLRLALPFLTGQETVGLLPRVKDGRGRERTDLPCAISYHWGNPGCHVLLLSDQDIFIDGMMFQKENDNVIFAYNSLRWLTDSGRRTNVLFLDNGEVVKDFTVPLKWVPGPGLPPPVAIADHLLAGLEQENAFNRLLRSVIPHRAILGMTAMLVTLALLARWLYNLMTRRVRFEADVPLVAAGPSLAAARPPLLEQRHLAVLKSGNFWEAAHDLARHCFEDRFPPPSHLWADDTIEGPALTVAGPAWQTWALRRRASQLWQLAYGGGPRAVSRREFARLTAYTHEVQKALEDGRLRLTWPPSPNGRKPIV